MPANWKYFRDEIVINSDFVTFIGNIVSGLPQGSTLLIGARNCQHEPNFRFPVPAGFNLILLADQYDAAGGQIDASGTDGAAAGSTGAPGLASPDDNPGNPGDRGGIGSSGTNGGALTLFGKTILNANLVSNGGTGATGGTGGRGGPPNRYRDPEQKGGFGFSAPGSGGQGGPGGPGGNGGPIAVVSVGAANNTVPVLMQSAGREGGAGGAGGVGAMGAGPKPRQAASGKMGPHGAAGQPGQTIVSQVIETQYWNMVVSTIGTDALEWAQYRLRVGEYRFRGYRTVPPYDGWRGSALNEFAAALLLDPGLVAARTDLGHLLSNRNMLGIARDVDIFPDFDRYDSFVSASAQLIQSLLLFAAGDLSAGILSDITEQSLLAEIDHMQSSINILHKEEQAAVLENQIAGQEKTDADKQVDDLTQQVRAAKDALDHASITFEGVVGIIGSVVSIVMAFPTGGASLLQFAPDLVAITNHIPHDDTILDTLAKEFLPDSMATSVINVLDGTVNSFSKDAGNLKTLIVQNYAEVKNLVNLTETIANIGSATSEQQAAYKQLLAKSVAAVHAQLLAGLRSSQTDILHQVAVAKLALQGTDLQSAQSELTRVKANITTLTSATQAIINASHSYFETLARFAFYAARALEIYTLDDLSAEIRFDYGFVHPDIDQDFASGRLTQASYAAAYQAAWREVPTLLNYRQRYLDYFANSPADLTRDAYIRYVTDPATLAAFAQTRTLEIDVALADPEFASRAEAKVEGVAVALIGAHGSSTFVDCLAEHSGISTQRKVDGTVVTQYLRPHSSVLQVKFQPLVPTDLIPNPNLDPLTAPRTTAFWGRGVATTWRFTIDDPNLDVSALTEVQVGVGYVAFIS